MNYQIKLLGETLPTSASGTSYFWFDSLSGSEKVNELFEYQLVVKVRDELNQPAHGYVGLEGYVSKQRAADGGTPASDLNLQSLIGTELAVRIRLDGLKLSLPVLDQINVIDAAQTEQNEINGARFYRGLVNRIEILPVRNRHAMYKITLVPWLWLLTKTSNYKIFQKKTVLQILEEVLGNYPYPVDDRCSGHYAVLDFQVQYGESDYAFIQRLMQEHGINFHFEHSQNDLSLVLSDNNAAYSLMQASGYQSLNIYPPNQRFPERAEYIEYFEAAQQLVSGKVSLSDYQFKQPKLIQRGEDQYLWDHHYAGQEVYEWHQGDFKDSETGQSKASLQMEQHYQHGYRAQGKGHLKGLQTGFRFHLNNHPNSESNRGWLVLGTQTLIHDISEAQGADHFYDSHVEFIVQPDDHVLRPDRTQSKPHGRPQTAIVVGDGADEIYTDAYGRVKVKFHWDRLGNQNKDAASSEINTCWLRVSTGWAGNNFGTIHLPRVGQEVIVDFFNGDPDMPFVSGRLTNPEQMPVWELPSQKALSGIKSKELNGSQSNQLVMDDTPEQVQVHLKSDHQSSELNLGYITRIPDPSGRRDYRGEGFELRTDGHGVIRTDKGLILTTYGKSEAEGHVKDIQESHAQLESAVEQHKAQTEVAINQKADDRSITVTAQTELKAQVDSIKGEGGQAHSFPELSEPHLVLGSTAGIAIAAQQSIHTTAEEQIALTSGKDVSIASGERLFASTAKGISLFTQQGGARLFSGKDKVEIQAQDGELEAIARQKVQIISTEDKIEATSPKEIVLNAGGSQIRITGDGIFITTSGKFEVKAAEHKFMGGANKQITLPHLPIFEIKPTDLALEYLHDDGEPVQGAVYEVIFSDGTKRTGQLDSAGKAILKDVPMGRAIVKYGEDARGSEEAQLNESDDWFLRLQ